MNIFNIFIYLLIYTVQFLLFNFIYIIKIKQYQEYLTFLKATLLSLFLKSFYLMMIVEDCQDQKLLRIQIIDLLNCFNLDQYLVMTMMMMMNFVKTSNVHLLFRQACQLKQEHSRKVQLKLIKHVRNYLHDPILFHQARLVKYNRIPNHCYLRSIHFGMKAIQYMQNQQTIFSYTFDHQLCSQQDSLQQQNQISISYLQHLNLL
ncbi:transmembrane protein, putative (macronuclear) [Tetrahymena thermophila SB210]|uniref:Transmembrane protein, putative n=1 Tax=Tetrahymena thermophila (strain SB210) TaxID=312017 RepID=W7X4B7_TETTS|nr:transmembrane protein, putative [Tetrahymena thermophila SB210]EWS72272.1 transmembrane protein, putative [Tetrahymena thermophila SB210]|eukprot:XP_012655212.1 transmembrane protein, putative [Tetrahymena thermophila SB210]